MQLGDTYLMLLCLSNVNLVLHEIICGIALFEKNYYRASPCIG